jgi:Holliday junction resolvasome RuvABC endonuclease subunit
MRLIAIDPGLRGCGVAAFETEGCQPFLIKACYITSPEKTLTGPVAWAAMAGEVVRTGRPDILVLEQPRIYPGVRREDPNDLIQLAGVLGAIAAHWESVPTIVAYYPAAWKGQVPKKVMTNRILKHLATGELSRLVSVGAKDHNTIDAIGLGLFHLGRMKRGGA